MNQDSDVSRLAAALNGPVIRYRNFGNGPTRAPQRPPVEPPDAEDAPRMRIYGDAAPPLVAPPPGTVVAGGEAPPDEAPAPLDTTPPDAAPPEAALPPPPPPARGEAPPRSLLDTLRGAADRPVPAEGLLAMLAAPARWDLPPPVDLAPAPPPLTGQPIRPHGHPPVAEPPPRAPQAPEPLSGPVTLAAMFRLVSAPPAAVEAAPPTRDVSLRDVLRGLRPARHG